MAPPPDERLMRAIARGLLDQVLARLDALDAVRPGNPLKVTLATEDFLIVLTMARLTPTLPAAPPAAEPPPPPAGRVKLQRVHRQLLAKATAEPVSTKALIGRAGYEVNSYSRGAVTYLVRHGLLLRTPDGVRLPPGSQGVAS